MTEVNINLEQIGMSLNVHRLQFRAEAVSQNMVCQLVGWLAGERQDPYCYETPSSWWQMLKKEHFPKWFLKRYPVKYTKTELTIKTLYPKLKTRIPLDLMGPVVRVMVMDRDIGCFVSNTEALTPFEVRESRVRMMSELGTDFCPRCHQPIFHKLGYREY